MRGRRYDQSYYERNPVRRLESAFRSRFFNILSPIFSNSPNLLKGDGKSALDVGCGYGYGAKILSELGYRVMGIDASPHAIEVAKERYKQLTFVVHDVHKPLPFSTKYDLIICIDVVEHLINPERGVKNMYKALKEGGNLILTTLNRVSPFAVLLGRDETHYNVRTKSQWLELFDKFGWSEKELYFRQYVFGSWELFKSFKYFNLPTLGAEFIFKLKK